MPGIHGELRQVAEFTGFTWLDCYASIGIYGRVVGFIGGVLAVFVMSTRPQVLLQTPVSVTGFYFL